MRNIFLGLSVITVLGLLPSLLLASFNHARYDKSITLFSPDGSLLQVDYAEKAALRGQPLLCIRTTDGHVIICNPAQNHDSLLDRRAVDKISQVDENIWIAFAGLTGDGRALVIQARELCCDFRLRFGTPPPVSYLANSIGKLQHLATLKGGERPYGVQVLVIGCDLGCETPSIYMTRPSGEVSRWDAVAVGRGSDKLTEALHRRAGELAPMEGTVGCLLDVFGVLGLHEEAAFGGYDFYKLSRASDGTVALRSLLGVKDVDDVRTIASALDGA